MQITNNTTAWQIAELMGTEADEQDGRTMLDLLSRDGITDTNELSEGAWLALIDESQEIRCQEEAASVFRA